MKKICKTLSIVLAFILISTLLVACKVDIGDDVEEIDPKRTQLYVSNFEGGFGDSWLYKLKARFEAYTKDKVYEEGKVGAQIMIRNKKENGMDLINKISGETAEVFFNEYVYYYEYLKEDLLLNISDVVTENLSNMGDNRSILSKMTSQQQEYYKKDNAYYGIPHYAGYDGIVYDVNLFDNKGLYFKDTGDSGLLEFIDPKSSSDVKSKGPDGKTGFDAETGIDHSRDDGLPSTYEEFFILCDYIENEFSLYPFIWTGKHYDPYLEKLLNALRVDFDGVEQTLLNYNLSGTAKNIITSINGDGNYSNKGEVSINRNNAYELYSTEGLYQSLSFMSKLVSNSDYYLDQRVFSPSHLHLEAQKDFLDSTLVTGKPIAMIVEGSWWEEESKDHFQYLSDRYGKENGRYERKFATMPLPKASKEKIGKQTIYDSIYSLAFARKDIAEFKIDLAKEFLKFAYTDESLVEFNVTTGTVKSLNYDLPESDYNKLSYFGKSLYEMHKSSDIVYPFSKDEMYINNQSFFGVHESFKSKFNNTEYLRPISYLRTKGASASSYFNGMSTYYKSIWSNTFNTYLN